VISTHLRASGERSPPDRAALASLLSGSSAGTSASGDHRAAPGSRRSTPAEKNVAVAKIDGSRLQIRNAEGVIGPQTSL
jgi:hypothetical protein